MSGGDRAHQELSRTVLVTASSLIGILACAGDLFMTYLLGRWYPGYDSLLQPMSDLGKGGSPVASLSSTWWAIMGLLFVIFGYGFYRAFSDQGICARAAGIVIALYGLGEGLGSGLLPESPGNGRLTTADLIHDFISTVGVFAVVSLPFVMMKIYRARQRYYLYWYSWFTAIAGIFFLLLFAFSWLYRLAYTGLWQRLFMVIYYLFLTCLAVMMLIRSGSTRLKQGMDLDTH